MKNTFKVLGTVALLAVFVFSFSACDDLSGLFDNITDKPGDQPTGTPSGTGGTLTITDIPSKYNGKYALFSEISDSPSGSAYLIGAQSINASTQVITLVRISNGKVSLPVWRGSTNGNDLTGFVRYSGSDNVAGVVVILDSATFNVSDTRDNQPVAIISFASISFSNGSATKSSNAGDIITGGDEGGSDGGGSGEPGGAPASLIGTWIAEFEGTGEEGGGDSDGNVWQSVYTFKVTYTLKFITASAYTLDVKMVKTETGEEDNDNITGTYTVNGNNVVLVNPDNNSKEEGVISDNRIVFSNASYKGDGVYEDLIFTRQ